MTEKTVSKIMDWSLIGVLISCGLLVLGWLWIALISGVTSMKQLETNSSRLIDHEQRIRLVEANVGELRNDVAWIRHYLENGSR